jgi:CelD/BcsL family acetyltransferase involved in cellulose biosynthesis
LQDRTGIARYLLTRFGQVDLLADLFGQRNSGLLLELANLHGDSRLRQVQLISRARKAEVLCDC